mgnify:FL=1
MMLFIAGACTSKEEKQVEGYHEFQENGVAQEIHRMKDYRYSDTVRWKGRLYTYEVVRRADDSLAVVTDDDGNRYADNFVKLTLRCGEETVFAKRFTKATFASWLDASFKKNALFEGMAFDKTVPQGLRFSTSVSYPLSDMCMPFTVTISPSGEMHIARDEILDNVSERPDSID